MGLRRIAGLAGGGIALVMLLGGCTVDDAFHFGWPKGGITPQSQRMYDLWIGSVVAAFVVGILVWGLIFWCIVRYRKKGDALPPQTRYNAPMEVLYSVLPFLIVAVLFYYTAIAQTYVNKIDPNPAVTVEVVAFKWNWQFRYLGQNGPDGQPVDTIGSTDYVPVLVVPVGKTIEFKQVSKDVIHSFWVPELLFKRDQIPGVTNKFQVKVEKTGAFVGRCAELCGTYHSMMNFELRAVTPENYEKFLAAKKAGKSTPEALEAAGEAPIAVTTDPFKTKRDARTTS
ncbi:aa3-type cytochrome oxidase subunit II [Longispora fulva]|uniref:cytochrome-c oxidase n=1 Tax=Longispora fulva TaxID=619741 RepID=A0A8J7GUY9_9ACTN|nr:cytochrome c oxidase subunit II [Longispora fulva]MBG6138658.1 cytochrome c oxidase subunit 2 [Longispora fulva]